MSKQTMARIGAAVGMTAIASLSGMAAFAGDLRHETSVVTAKGIVVTPASSQEFPASDNGQHMHTNTRILFPNGIHAENSAPSGNYETPASLACVYGLVKVTTGCIPSKVTTVVNAGSKLVIIVDAYDDPTATNDLTAYSKQFGLPAITSSNFEVVYASGKKPSQDSSGGWELEESLDIEMAHALAPNAKVILMEAASANTTDLLAADTAAAALAVAAGGGEVSNSWGGGESANEESYESTFTGTNVVFVASTGDSAGTIFPSVLQNVVGAGGTSINRNSSGSFESQTSWSAGGGGSSAYVPVPTYQSAIKKISKIVGKKRGVPDFSFDANPNTGVWIYDTTPYEGSVRDWIVIGGTSVASPALAAVLNSAGTFSASTATELTEVYKGYTDKANWTDITSGSCGNNGGASAKKGYDFCTGIGVPNGFGGK
jgi:subtilase family serine protease